MLSLAAGVALLVFLAFRSRRNPLFLAGAAAFIALGRAAFVDIVPDQVLLSPMSIKTSDLVFAMLALGWLYARRSRPTPCVGVRARWAWLAGLLAVFLALEYALAFSGAAGFHPMTVLPTRDWVCIPLGYLMTLDILRRFSARETAEYVGVLCLLSTLLMVLYIASALGVPVYPYPKYFTTAYGGVAITRDFTTLPIWSGLAWGYYLSRQEKTGWVMAALAVLTAGTLLTYTRSLVLIAVGVAVLAALLSVAHRDLRARALVVLGPVLLLVLGVVIAGPAVMPAQFGYLASRFSTLQLSGTSIADRNISIRMQRFERARQAAALVDPVFGAGLVDASPDDAGREHSSYDSDWIRILYRTGWAGVVVFLAPLVLGLWWGAREFLTQPAGGPTHRLLLMGVLAASYALATRFTGMVYFWWPALSLFALAVVAYASGFQTDVEAESEHGQTGSEREVVSPS